MSENDKVREILDDVIENGDKVFDQEYEMLEKACVRWGCNLPEPREFHTVRANTPAFIRAYYEQKGMEKARKEMDAKVCECGVTSYPHIHVSEPKQG